MSIHRRSRGRDVAIRLAGLTMLPIGAVSIDGLYHLVHVPPAQERTLLELGLAAGGFLSISLGSALLSLGAHLFDEVEVSARWTHGPGAGQRQKWVSPDPLLEPAQPRIDERR